MDKHPAIDGLLSALLVELRAAPQGISEYELLRALEQRHPAAELRTADLRDPVGLYRTHFLLFHHLYRLREQLRPRGEMLDIHCLCIRLYASATAPADGALDRHDPLAEFYLDLNNLEGVDRAEVDNLLRDFWRRYSGHDRRAEALAELGLAADADNVAAKRQYRRVAMRNQPERGGDKEPFQRLTAAMEVLDLP